MLLMGLALPVEGWHTMPGALLALHFLLLGVGWLVVTPALWRSRAGGSLAAIVLGAFTLLPGVSAMRSVLQRLPSTATELHSVAVAGLAIAAALVAFAISLRQLAGARRQG